MSLPNVEALKSRAVTNLLTMMRDRTTSPHDFKLYSDRLMHLLAEEGIACLPSNKVKVITPTGNEFDGVKIDDSNICLVSIIRAGDSLLQVTNQILPHASVGKILIQRDETTEEKIPKLFYSKLPPNISSSMVILCDPMLATGGSSLKAVEALIEAGVSEENILFLNVIACPEGIANFHAVYPKIKIVTGVIDDGLNEEKYIVPGLGDYGDRYFGTI